MRKTLIPLLIASALTSSVHAATWYGFSSVGSDKTAYFFDRDTIVKEPGSVTIWIKYVNEENSPDPDGSYATATKYRYDCKHRTLQALISVTYDKNQNHMRTISNPAKPTEAVPGSIGEAAWKVVCEPTFPNQKDAPYAKVGDNDIYSAAKRLFSLYNTLYNDPAPK